MVKRIRLGLLYIRMREACLEYKQSLKGQALITEYPFAKLGEVFVTKS